MWPWGHAAVGYLLYTAFRRTRRGRTPGGAEAWLVVIGTQVPDLVDKPLAWSLGVLPTGRSLGHSLLVAALALSLCYGIARRYRRPELATALGLGWVSHSLVDVLPAILSGEWAYVNYLAWPVLTTPPFPTPMTFAAHLRNLEPTGSFFLEWILVALALVAWVRDETPGLPARIRTRLAATVER